MPWGRADVDAITDIKVAPRLANTDRQNDLSIAGTLSRCINQRGAGHGKIINSGFYDPYSRFPLSDIFHSERFESVLLIKDLLDQLIELELAAAFGKMINIQLRNEGNRPAVVTMQ